MDIGVMTEIRVTSKWMGTWRNGKRVDGKVDDVMYM